MARRLLRRHGSHPRLQGQQTGDEDDPRGFITAAAGDIRRTTNLADFFKDRTKKLHADIVRLRLKTAQKRFPTSDEELKGFSVSQLRQLVGVLDDKLREVETTMKNLKAPQRQPPFSLHGHNEIATNNSSGMMELTLSPSPRRMMTPMDMTFQNHKFLENSCNVDDQRSFFEYAGDYDVNSGCDDLRKNAMMEQKLIPWESQYQTPMPLSCPMLAPMNGQLQYHQQQQLELEPHVLAQSMLRNGSPMFGSAYGVGYGATLTVPNAHFKAAAQPQYSWNPLGILNYNFDNGAAAGDPNFNY